VTRGTRIEDKSNWYEVNAGNKSMKYGSGVPWQLAKDYFIYHYSAARFYETGMDDVGFLKKIFTVLDGD
jgi:hypothetical protein